MCFGRDPWPSQGGAVTAVVVTSENSADFYAQRLGIAQPEPDTPTEPADKAKTVEGAVESAANESRESPEPEATEQLDKVSDPVAKQKLNLRFSELTEKRKLAEADAAKARDEAQAARERAELAERQAAELRTKYEQPKVEGPGAKPERVQFVSDEEHEKALVDWAGEKAVHERDQRDRAAKMEQQWTERQAAVRAEIPDYDAAIAASANLMVSNEVRDAIVSSEQGPKILHYLATNPAFVTELARDGVNSALRKIGRLEAKFEGAKPASAEPARTEVKTEAAKPAAAATEISRAPAPITPLKTVSDGTGGTQVDSKGNFVGTYADWKAARKAGKIK